MLKLSNNYIPISPNEMIISSAYAEDSSSSTILLYTSTNILKIISESNCEKKIRELPWFEYHPIFIMTMTRNCYYAHFLTSNNFYFIIPLFVFFEEGYYENWKKIVRNYKIFDGADFENGNSTPSSFLK